MTNKDGSCLGVATVKGRIIPAVRMTRGGKWVKANAKEYLAKQEWLAWELKTQMTPMPERTPLCLKVEFTRAWLFRGDLDNLVKSILDAAQRAGIILNDAYIVRIEAEKHISTEDDDLTEVSIWQSETYLGQPTEIVKR